MIKPKVRAAIIEYINIQNPSSDDDIFWKIERLDKNAIQLICHNRNKWLSVDNELLEKAVNACVESSELCIAVKGGYMVWISENVFSVGYEPSNPLFKGVKNNEKNS